MSKPGEDALAASAAAEWSNLVTTAVLGTDRRPLPRPAPGWELPTKRDDDVAVELLNRAAAVATAKRAGVRPMPAPPPIEAAPADHRRGCSEAAGRHLAAMLSGHHDILLPEWMSRCAANGQQPPPHLIPALLVRGRRNPAFDVVARNLIGPRAAWLADAVPDLGVRSRGTSLPPGTEAFAPPAAPPDSSAVVTAIVETFLDRTATWAVAAQLRLAVAAIDPAWLPPLILELNRAPFHASTERTRIDLLGVAQLRREMIDSFNADSSQ